MKYIKCEFQNYEYENTIYHLKYNFPLLEVFVSCFFWVVFFVGVICLSFFENLLVLLIKELFGGVFDGVLEGDFCGVFDFYGFWLLSL